MSESSRVVIVHGEEWWRDILVPWSVDLGEARKRWSRYQADEYLAGLKANNGFPSLGKPYISFPDWLIQREGCADAELETVDIEP